MIHVEHLTKAYGKKIAVSDLSFSLTPGKVTGFLGPNGSGKSTTMRCIVGLDTPNSGKATINGVPYTALPSPITTVGALLDGKAFHPGRTARGQLLTVARTHGIPKSRVEDVLEMTGIRSVANKRLKGFSLGMGQRLGIALALLGDPRVLIFDEPVNGLDPDGVRWIRTLMRELAREGRTIFVSSHLMSEMALTADELVIIAQGKLVASGPISQFTESASHVHVYVSSPQMDDLHNVLISLGYEPHFEAPSQGYANGRWRVDADAREEIGYAAASRGITLLELSQTHSSLEDVFMEMTGAAVEYTSTNNIPGLPSNALQAAENNLSASPRQNNEQKHSVTHATSDAPSDTSSHAEKEKGEER